MATPTPNIRSNAMVVYVVNIDASAPLVVAAASGVEAIDKFLAVLKATMGRLGTYTRPMRADGTYARTANVYTNEANREETAVQVRAAGTGMHYTVYAVAHTVIE